MKLKAPKFWAFSASPNWQSRMLRPASRIWAYVAQRRMLDTRAERIGLPVICIGNFTVGGTGKTPLAIEVGRLLHDMGERPAFLTRGYGGRASGPLWVEPECMAATETGDEPLLLARHFPTLVAKDRLTGARTIAEDGRASVIVMDDGLQSGRIARDLSIAVIDGMRGLGNGEVLPAGPLRAPIDAQLRVTDAVVVVWPPDAGSSVADSPVLWLRDRFTKPVMEASVEPRGDMSLIAGRKVVAFAGIGSPERFFALLTLKGARIVAAHAFADHARLSEAEARDLLDLAIAHDAALLTTEKDLARLAHEVGARGELAARSATLPIRIELAGNDRGRLAGLLQLACRSGRRSGT